MPAKKIAKVVKVAKPKVLASSVVDEIEEPVNLGLSDMELVYKFFMDGCIGKGKMTNISINGDKGNVVIDRHGENPKIVFGETLLDAINKLGA